jgi:high-affinity iron transporter
MLQTMIVTLREGVEAALIVGITIAYLDKIGRRELRRVVWAALAAAVLGSIATAIVVDRFSLNADIVEGWVMLLAAVFVVSMIIFMAKTGRRMKGDIENRLSSLAKGSSLGLFAFIFLMVMREGVEMVLMLAAVSLNTAELLNVVGTVLGIGLAVTFGVLFVKGSVKIDLRKFFRVTTIILVFVAFQLVISGLHELSENGVLPSSKREMALIGPIVRNEFFFFVTIVALTGLMVLFEVRRRGGVVSDGPTSSAERRKAEWTARRERLWGASVYVCAFVFISMATAEFVYAKATTALSPSTPVTFTDGHAVIPLATVSDGHLHRFRAAIGSTEARFLLYKKPDGKVAVVFDACEICGPVGFYESAEGLICKNCAAPINRSSVGMPGGCNPIPLRASQTPVSVIVAQTDIANGAHVFEQK